MRRSNEPLFWLPFAGGMMIDAMAIPALALITGLLIPLGLVSGDGIRAVVTHPLGRLAMFAIIAMTFWHAAHRLRFALVDIGLHGAKGFLGILLYGGALVGTIIAGVVAFTG
jgi:fumarate reductase subunit D